MVCSGRCSHLMELRNTAMSSASSEEISTVDTQSTTVLRRQSKKRWYCTTRTKLFTPKGNTSPPAARRPL